MKTGSINKVSASPCLASELIMTDKIFVNSSTLSRTPENGDIFFKSVYPYTQNKVFIYLLKIVFLNFRFIFFINYMFSMHFRYD